LGSTCAGEGAGDGAMDAPLPGSPCSLSLAVLSVLRCAEKRTATERERRERESGEENELGFLRNPTAAAFDLPKRAGEPSIRSNGYK